ncbi:MAG: efflux RND transporter periplasmic adaptor subunit [Burkholderiales bacterium]|nr:efflux RND transporter periplasmic adaptor subunit [Burkholderiales bacterium]MDE2287107.1 efflux RND transporter periplasmic adaptor subunit [Burkholderiales bacterium]MDE2610087.1 efflux RND transporter periplasmic adaptor subunit [Burkholderiales bacterium]
MRFGRNSTRLIYAGAAVSALLLAGCAKKQAPAPKPFEVGVVTVHAQSVPVTSELPGRTSAYLVAQVRARVDGIVLRREFTEGGQVKAGQRLYQIDPAPYRAALDSASATLQKARANLTSTSALAARYKVLVAAHAVSKQDYDNAAAAQEQAAADVAAGKAAVETARINLGYTDVTSPITGTIGVSNVTPGAYVQASAATLMATVQQTDPIYVDVTQSTVDLLRLRRALADGRLQSAGPNEAKVKLVLDDGSVYPLEGKLEFTDITVDQTTGTVTLRAVFPNPKHELLPGMFVRARLEEGVNDRAILVPEIGVTHDAKGTPTALVVGADDKVALRTLSASQTFGTDWIVDSGLKPGDRVIVAGVQKVQPGMTVKPVEQPMPPVNASGAAAAVPGQSQ